MPLVDIGVQTQFFPRTPEGRQYSEEKLKKYLADGFLDNSAIDYLSPIHIQWLSNPTIEAHIFSGRLSIDELNNLSYSDFCILSHPFICDLMEKTSFNAREFLTNNFFSHEILLTLPTDYYHNLLMLFINQIIDIESWLKLSPIKQ